MAALLPNIQEIERHQIRKCTKEELGRKWFSRSGCEVLGSTRDTRGVSWPHVLAPAPLTPRFLPTGQGTSIGRGDLPVTVPSTLSSHSPQLEGDKSSYGTPPCPGQQETATVMGGPPFLYLLFTSPWGLLPPLELQLQEGAIRGARLGKGQQRHAACAFAPSSPEDSRNHGTTQWEVVVTASVHLPSTPNFTGLLMLCI